MRFKQVKYRKRTVEASRRLRLETLESREMLSGTGLTGQYFHNTDFTGLAAERTEAVDFSWASAAPVEGLDADTFSVRWTGQVEAEFTEEYTFRTTSNQGVRLWVDGQLLIDNWESHNTEVDTGTITLNANQKYDLRLEYYEEYGSAVMHLKWQSASQSLEFIPASRLYTSPEGLRGEYSDNFGGSAARIDSDIDFDWGFGRAHPSTAVDQFNVSWTGFIRADFSEEYDFSLQSDEGVRLWIGNELVIDDWEPHSTHAVSGEKTLEAGKWYDIRIEYFDQTGNAEVALSWSSENQTGVGVFETVPSQNLRAAKSTSEQFVNPLGWGQDPYVTLWNNSYLHVRSAGGSIYIDKADALQDIHTNNPNSTTTKAWTAPNGTNYSHQIWAPEIHQLNGKWYIYVAASDGNNETHRMHVLERDAADPMGSYVYKGQISTNLNRWAIDGTVLTWEGQMYFVWSGWAGATDTGQQNLYIAEMSDPLTISGDRHLISTPTQAWEMHGLSINEGPQILINEDKLHIIYSGSAYWQHEYALGRTTYDGVGSILDSSSWQKSATPVFQQAGDIVGTGHASFTTSIDGTENWIVYHAHHDKNNFQDDRDIFIQPFDFSADGNPDFGAPIPASTSQSVPLGVADPERPFIAGDFNADGNVDTADHDVWRLSFGEVVFPGISADGNGNGVIDAADYTVWRDGLAANQYVDPTVAYWRHEEGSAAGSIAAGANTVLDSSGNDNHMQTFDPSFTSATYSTSVSPLALRSGLANTLSLDFGPGGDDMGLNDDNFSGNTPINSQLFDAITVEIAFNMNSIGGYQALLGKDGAPVTSPVPPLKVMIRGDDFPSGIDNQLFVEWIDGDGDIHSLAGGSTIIAGNWNHMAFTLTDTTAELWVAAETGSYVLVNSISGGDFAGANSEVLFGSDAGYTIGRGSYDGNPADWSNGLIDEVRISDVALDETNFLFDPNIVSSFAFASSTESEETPVLQFDLFAKGQIDASAVTAVVSFHTVRPKIRLDLTTPLVAKATNALSLLVQDEAFASLDGQVSSSIDTVLEVISDTQNGEHSDLGNEIANIFADSSLI